MPGCLGRDPCGERRRVTDVQEALQVIDDAVFDLDSEFGIGAGDKLADAASVLRAALLAAPAPTLPISDACDATFGGA